MAQRRGGRLLGRSRTPGRVLRLEGRGRRREARNAAFIRASAVYQELARDYALNPQEVLYLMGAAAREPPAMAAAWAERMMSLGREAEASLKMLTLLHKLQLHSPQFIATLLGSSFHGHSFADVLKELWTRLRQMPSSKRGPFICAYLVYLQLRLSSPAYATEHRQTPVAGRTAQRRLELAQLAAQIPTLETLFDRALDADACVGGVVTVRGGSSCKCFP